MNTLSKETAKKENKLLSYLGKSQQCLVYHCPGPRQKGQESQEERGLSKPCDDIFSNCKFHIYLSC